MATDLTLSNPKIVSYLTGKSDLAPVGEFLYIHTHPMVRNFLSEIEVLINKANAHLAENPQKKGVAVKFKVLGQQLGSQLSSPITEDTAPEILNTVKAIYQICEALPL